MNAVQPVSSHIDGDDYERCGDREKKKKKQADKKRREDKTKTGQNMLEKWKHCAFPICAVCRLPVFTHSLSVMLHCCSGDSVVVVKGEIKTAVPPLGMFVLGTGGVKIILLLVSVLMAEVVADLLVKGTGCPVAVEGRRRVVCGEAVVITRDLAAGAGDAVVSRKEAVKVSCGGGRGDT